MKIQNWLKKKYPHFYKLINAIFADDIILDYLKRQNYELAVLKRRVCYDGSNYIIGTIFLVKKRGDMSDGTWDGTYSLYGLFNSARPITPSGYHHITLDSEADFDVLKDNLKVGNDGFPK